MSPTPSGANLLHSVERQEHIGLERPDEVAPDALAAVGHRTALPTREADGDGARHGPQEVSREKFGKFERNGKETRDSGVYKPSVCREKFGKFERPGKKRGRLMQSRSLGHAGRCVGHVVGSLI